MKFKKNSRDDQDFTKWVPLNKKNAKDIIFHGAIIRCKAKWPYEDFVDFMVIDNLDIDRGLTIVVSSGYKAGLILVNLPKESEENDGNYTRCLNAEWLKLNWERWVYPDCEIENVYISDGYLPAISLPELN